MLVLALDVGTSSTRALCFDTQGRVLADSQARVRYEPVTTRDGGSELDPDALLDAVASAVDGCLARCGPRASAIAAVGASVFWHGLLALGADGRPVTPLITWADTRSAAAAAELRRTLDERAIHARTGAPLHSTFFPAKLRWLRQTQGIAFARARTWCGFAEYLSARLTGSLRTSLSMASGTGLMDQSRGVWDHALLETTGIGRDQLPPVNDGPVTGLAPAFAARWPALARLPWYPAHGDGACSNLGSDCASPERIALNLGTSAALRVVLPAAGGSTPWGLFRYRVDGARAVIGGATSEGGNVMAWSREALALPRTDEEIERAVADVAPDGHGLTALPFLTGERSPGWRPEARAALAGLSLGTTAADILRALMEAVAYRLAAVYERLAPLASPNHTLVASGGALAHSRAWTAIVTDVLGVPLTLSSQAEASARGAALLALDALGAGTRPALAPGRTVVPDPERHARYRAARERHRRLYDNVVGSRDS